MLISLLTLIFCRPFISSLAFPTANLIYSSVLLAFLLSWIIQKGLSIEALRDIKYALLLFMVSILLSLIFSQDKMHSLREIYQYVSGILLCGIAASLPRDNKKKVIKCILLAGFLVSLLALYQYFFTFNNLLRLIHQGTLSVNNFALEYIERRRPFFPFVTPNILAGFLGMIIPLAFYQKKNIWLAAPMLIAFFLAKSLGALFSLLIGMFLYFYLKGRLDRKKILSLMALGAAIILVAALRNIGQKQHLQPLFSAVMRLHYWQEAWKVIIKHPLTGIGPGNFNLTLSRYAHNSYLQIWAETGILGIISFLLLAFFSIKAGIKNKAFLLACANIIFLAHNLVDFSFFLPEVSLIWWVILGLALAG